MNENKQGYLMLSVAGCHHGMLFSVCCFIWLSCHTPEPARLLQWRQTHSFKQVYIRSYNSRIVLYLKVQQNQSTVVTVHGSHLPKAASPGSPDPNMVTTVHCIHTNRGPLQSNLSSEQFDHFILDRWLPCTCMLIDGWHLGLCLCNIQLSAVEPIYTGLHDLAVLNKYMTMCVVGVLNLRYLVTGTF